MKSKITKKIVAGMLGVMLVAGVAVGCGSTSSGSSTGSEVSVQTEAIAAEAKESSLLGKTIDGQEFNQSDISNKDLTVVNFWSTICGFCVEELPDLAKIEQKLPENISLVTVCLDGETDKTYAESILKETGFTGKTLISYEGSFNELVNQVQYTPTTIFLDSNGNVIGESLIGGQDDIYKSLETSINNALSQSGKDTIKIEK